MHLISPLPSAGFNRFDTSNEPPEADPAPIIVCISSIKRIGLFSFDRKFNTPLSLFSKSPLYLVPAISAAISSE